MIVRRLVFILTLGGAVTAAPEQSLGQTAGADRVQRPRLRLTIPSFGDAASIPPAHHLFISTPDSAM
jgi:hypothetical protein